MIRTLFLAWAELDRRIFPVPTETFPPKTPFTVELRIRQQNPETSENGE